MTIDPVKPSDSSMREVGRAESEDTVETVILCGGDQIAAQFRIGAEKPRTLEAVVFNAADSECGETDKIVQYDWDFGDGVVTQSRTPIVEHNFQRAGKYVVRMVATAASGLFAEVGKLLRVSYRLAVEHEPRFPVVAKPARFIAKAFVNLHAEDGIAEYAWDLDGSGVYEVVTEDGEVVHMYESPGTYAVKVRVTSVGGIVEVVSHSVTVVEMTQINS